MSAIGDARAGRGPILIQTSHEDACDAREDANKRVSDIALNVGYSDLPTFCTNFKSRFEDTPKQVAGSPTMSRKGTDGNSARPRAFHYEPAFMACLLVFAHSHKSSLCAGAQEFLPRAWFDIGANAGIGLSQWGEP
jgi:hypothetical protein